jgi:hypothetical protein
MANRLRIARGAAANRPADLLYGELFWEKSVDGVSQGVLYMGTPDGTTSGALPIGGARAMESLFHKGTWTTAGAYPAGPTVGDMYLWGVDGTGELTQYKVGDLMLFIGDDTWLRINNQNTEELTAANVTFDGAAAGLDATNAQNAITELAQTKMHYAGSFAASGLAFPPNPEVGGFYIATDIGLVSGTQFQKGDAAFFNGTGWSKIPFSEGFPVAGVTFAQATVNKIAKWNTSTGELTDTILTDNGSVLDVAGQVEIRGRAQSYDLKIGDQSEGQFESIIKSGDGSGTVTLTLPGQSGTIALTTDHDEASEVAFNNAGTGIEATNVQGALVEIEREKLQYAGKITSLNYPTTPVIGGLYLLTVSGEIGALNYKKGDFAYYNGTEWNRIPAGAAVAADIEFDPTDLELPNGDAVTQTDVQSALAHLFEKKADVDGDGKILASQLPDFVTGSLTYRGAWDASEAYPSNPQNGDYWIVSVASSVHGDFEVGDWLVYHVESGTGQWDKIDNSEKMSGIKVGADTLHGVPEFAVDAPLTIGAESGVVTIGIQDATSTTKGVVQVGDGLVVAAGVIAVDEGDGIRIDPTTKKLTLDLGNGVKIDSNGKLGLLVDGNFQFESGVGTLELKNTGVTAGTHTKVTVDAKGRITAGADLAVSDLPIYVSGAVGGTEVFDPSNGKIASIATAGPGVAVSKSGDLITLDFTQVNATAFSPKFDVEAQTGFDWSARATAAATISSITGAINANREDLYEFVELLATQGAALGVAAGANLIGVKGIVGVTPTGAAEAGDSSNLQAMLQGIKAYTDAQISNFVPNGVVNATGTDLAGHIAVFTDNDTITKSHLTQTAEMVSSAKELEVQARVTIEGASAELRLAAGEGFYSKLRGSAAGASTTLTLPSAAGVAAGTILADFSIIDGGDYDA